MKNDESAEAMKAVHKAMADPDTVRITITFDRVPDGGWNVNIKVKKDDLLTEHDPNTTG